MTSQCSGNKNKPSLFVYNFNEKWDNQCFFVNVKNKCVSLIYNASNDVMLNHISLPCIKIRSKYRDKSQVSTN
jgi:hypothetical protein